MESTITITPGTYADLRSLEIRPDYELIDPEKQFESEEWFNHYARSIRKADQLIGVFGVKPVWDGVGHCFAFVHKDARRFPKTLVIAGNRIMEIATSDEMGFWRLQATVEAHFNRGIRYLFHLGFSIDGLMPKFGPDASDHLMMSRLV